MIKKVLSSAILSIFLDKKAKKNFFAKRENDKLKNDSKNMQPTLITNRDSENTINGHVPDIKRQELIKNAVEVHKENSEVLADLSKSQKQRLRKLALQMLLGKSINSNKAHNEGILKTLAADTETPAERKILTQAQNTERQTLIKDALAAHKKYSKALDNLSKGQKKKLQRLAMQKMFGKIKE